jgi:hypothetical protein
LKLEGVSCEVLVTHVTANHGDQIGRILAYFATLGSLLENHRDSPIFCLLFSTDKVLFYFWQNALGYNLGDFFQKLIWSP